MARRTRYAMAAAAALMISTSTAAPIEGRWLQQTSSSSSSSSSSSWSVSSDGSGSGLPLEVTTPPVASTPVPTRAMPSSTSPPSAEPVSAEPIAQPTTTPTPTSSPPTAEPVTRPPGSPSTPNFDPNGTPIASEGIAPSTRSPSATNANSNTNASVSPTATRAPSSSTGVSPTRAPTNPIITNSQATASDAPWTSDTRDIDSASVDNEWGSGSSASGSDDSASGSTSSSSSFSSSSSSSSSSIFIPPVATLPTASSAPTAGETETTAPTTPVRTTRRPQSAFHKAMAYISVGAAALCLALLVALHLFAFDAPWLNWPHEWLSANGWELLLFLGYLQQLASLSQMELLNMPSFMAQFSDAFAWSNFLMQRTNILHDDLIRRLDETTAVTKGLDAYGDRIGIASSDLLVNGVVGIAVVFAFLCVVFVFLLLCGKNVHEDKFDLENSVVSHAAHTTNSPTRRRGTLWVLGFCVILWFVALYPITMLASFDLESAHANVGLAVVALVLFCIVLLGGLGYVVLTKTDEELMSINSLKVYGALYAELTHGFRWFFLATAFVQIALGLCVGTIREEATQLMVALVVVVGYLVTVLLCSPFTSQTPLLLTAAVCGIKILNYSVAFAFVSDKNISLAGRNRAGDAIVVITTLVLLLWLARVLVMLATFIRLYAERRHTEVDTPAYYGARESIKTGVALETNPILGGSGVYVTMMMTPATSPGQHLGSEFGDSFDTGAPRRTARIAQL